MFQLRRMTMLILPAMALSTLSGCSDESATAAVEPAARPVKTVEIVQSSDTRQLRYSGTVAARSEAAIGFRVAGKIVERLVDVGDRVPAGAVLARIDIADYDLQLRSAEATLQSAERQVETAKLAFERAQGLYQKQVTTKAQLEQAQLTLNQALASRDSAASSVTQARNQVEYGSLTSDKAGIVTAVSADIGQVVAAGSPVITVAADGEKEAVIAVPESEVLAFSSGQNVDVSFWASEDLSVRGTVREIAGSADTTSRTFNVRVSLPDDKRILLGMTARVVAAAPTASKLYEVPLAALAKDASDQTIVWAVDVEKSTVTPKPVTVKEFSDAGVMIAKGLKPGDVVVVAGAQFMSENMKVKLTDEQVSKALIGTHLIASR